MAWPPLLESLLDRLATKLAQKAEAQMDVAVEAALDQTEDRIEQMLRRMEVRLRAAASQGAPPLPVAPEGEAVAPPDAGPLTERQQAEMRAQLRSRIARYLPEPPDR